jgi:predicted O-methyltransferase YrrM
MSQKIIASTDNLNLVKNKLLDLYEQFDLMFTDIEQKAKQSYNEEQMSEFNKQLLIINQFATIVLMYEDISTRYIDNLKAIKTQNNQLDKALKYISVLGGDINLIKYS